MMDKINLGRKAGRDVELTFNGEEISSDGGLILINKVDDRLGLIESLAHNIPDVRDPLKIKHTVREILTQRIYAIAAGHEDLNDHNLIRHDSIYQTLLNKDIELASPSTICRLENNIPLKTNFENQKILVDTFINSHDAPPKSLTLDFDPTDTTLYGDQEGKHYHGYYRDYCYLPLIVTCDQHLLVAHLRPSNIDGAKHVWAILSLLVKRIRQFWPNTEIIFRADSGLCRHKMLNWCEDNHIKYIVGLPGNNVLNDLSEGLREKVKQNYELEKETQKEYGEFEYSAKSWRNERRVIVKAEHNGIGSNTRYVVTNMEGSPEYLYCDVYCQRGDMENRIKEVQTDMFGDRLSATSYATNQLRLMLSAISYIYMNTLKCMLAEPNKAKMYCKTIRLKIIKVAVIIRKNTRKIYLDISKNYPYRELFMKALGLLHNLE
jgi:hypothetical protein